MKLPKDIKDEIWQYCKANNITNVDEFINNMVSRGFTAEKFGAVPWEKPAKVKEVEKIVEKEVIKEVYKTDDEVVNKLQEELDELGIGRPSTYSNMVSIVQERKQSDKLSEKPNQSKDGQMWKMHS